MSLPERTIRASSTNESQLIGSILLIDENENNQSANLLHTNASKMNNLTNSLTSLKIQESLNNNANTIKNDNYMKIFANRPVSAPPAVTFDNSELDALYFNPNLNSSLLSNPLGGLGSMSSNNYGISNSLSNNTPAITTMPIVINGEVVSPNDPRLTPAYYAYYHAQRPIDPRLPAPLFNWSSVGTVGSVLPSNNGFDGIGNAPHPLSPTYGGSNYADQNVVASNPENAFYPSTYQGTEYGNNAQSYAPSLHSHDVSNHYSNPASQFSPKGVNNHGAGLSTLSANQQAYLSRYSPQPSPSRSPAPHLPTCTIFRASTPLSPSYCSCGSNASINRTSQPSPQPYHHGDEHNDNRPPGLNLSKKNLDNIPSAPPSARNKKNAMQGGSKMLNANMAEVISTPGMLLEFAIDQHGSRFIQQHLEVALESEKLAIFELLLPETIRLCLDVFGNYVIQKMLDYSTPAMRHDLILQLRGNVHSLSLQMYGCRVVQKAIELGQPEEQTSILNEIVGQVRALVIDQNGNHVIQKAIERVSAPQIQFIVNDFIGQVLNLGMHPYGCRVIQRLLEHCEDEQKNPIMEEIQRGCLELVQDQYGNYVIQHVLEHGSPWQRSPIIQTVIMNVVGLAKHKFASNVVESCFIFATDAEKMTFVDHVINANVEGTTPIALMVRDQYANYVVQRIIDVSQGAVRMCFIEGLKLKVPNLRKISYGKHIISRIEKITGRPF